RPRDLAGDRRGPRRPYLARGRRPRHPRPVHAAERLALQLQALDLQQLLDPVAAVLAAVAGLAVAAERRQRVEGAAVDLDLTGADAAGDGDRPLLVGRPDAAGEPVVG